MKCSAWWLGERNYVSYYSLTVSQCLSSCDFYSVFGGENNPKRVETECEAGDVIIIPAGVAHRLLDDYGTGYTMVGSYPKGSAQWDMCYGREGEESKVENIKKLAWFTVDPIYGESGPVLDGA